MRRIQSAPAIQRLVERGASPVGNWARHLSSQPHRYTKEKVSSESAVYGATLTPG